MTRDEMIKRLEAVALWVSEMADGLPPHSAAESMATGIESDVDAVLAALRSRPAPPDDLALRHAWEAGFRLCRSYGDNHHHFDGEQKERRWLDYIKGLAAPAPVAAPAPEPGQCRLCGERDGQHGQWCQMRKSAPETRVSYSCPHCGREYDRPAPAPETPAPDAMPEVMVGDLVRISLSIVWGARRDWRIVEIDRKKVRVRHDWDSSYGEWTQAAHIDEIERNGVVIWRRQEAQP